MLSRRVRRSGLAFAAALVMGLCAVPGVGHATGSVGPERAGSTSYAFRSGAWSQGGFRWSFRGYRSGPSSSVTVRAAKRASTDYQPTQSYEWQFYGLSGTSVSISPTLLNASVNTGGGMGTYGAVKMHLKAPSPRRKHVGRCPTTGAVLYRTYARMGAFVGSFAFHPNAPGLPAAVKTLSVPVTVTKRVEAGGGCPVFGPCHTQARTFNGLHYDGISEVTDWVGARRNGSSASIRLHTSHMDAIGQVSFDAEIAARVPPGAVVIGNGAVTLYGSVLAPFGSGTLRLTKQSASTDTFKHCTTTTIDELYESGKLTGKFVTGAFSFDLFDNPYATITKRL
jgi:hypothetical protein